MQKTYAGCCEGFPKSPAGEARQLLKPMTGRNQHILVEKHCGVAAIFFFGGAFLFSQFAMANVPAQFDEFRAQIEASVIPTLPHNEQGISRLRAKPLI